MRCKCDCIAHNGFLTAKGLEEAAQRFCDENEVLAVSMSDLYLDKVGSVSGSFPEESIFEDALLEEQYRRFHNGS